MILNIRLALKELSFPKGVLCLITYSKSKTGSTNILKQFFAPLLTLWYRKTIQSNYVITLSYTQALLTCVMSFITLDTNVN